MFTGLIKAVGTVCRKGKALQIEGSNFSFSLKPGDSVAVDGVCLTVTELTFQGFLADISEETLLRTNLIKKAEKGGMVNIEPALQVTDRLDGHLVTGHVDGIGEIISIKSLKNSWTIEVVWKDSYYGRYICEKGSICLNGISLTIADCSEDGTKFWIAVIPQTWTSTSIGNLAVGDLVNLEVDILAKYTEKLLTVIPRKVISSKENDQTLTNIWLTENGWN